MNLDQLINIFLIMLTVSGIFVLAIGMITVFSWALRLKAPADNSNRINRIRLWWYAVSAPHRSIKSFYWLGGDETDSLKDNTWG